MWFSLKNPKNPEKSKKSILTVLQAKIDFRLYEIPVFRDLYTTFFSFQKFSINVITLYVNNLCQSFRKTKNFKPGDFFLLTYEFFFFSKFQIFVKNGRNFWKCSVAKILLPIENIFCRKNKLFCEVAINFFTVV